jgi:hypothetical protein
VTDNILDHELPSICSQSIRTAIDGLLAVAARNRCAFVERLPKGEVGR